MERRSISRGGVEATRSEGEMGEEEGESNSDSCFALSNSCGK